ncbi:RDD family protein [Stagnihabitans tardus]|uniref:RDD family protein n=1 Tax=Stagnihabitans tardus TaxID=2699202 RepID=A0AAE4YDB7_9RHOB|nr:RDD family protein [Stagnihabitans tardus]NBZ87480.1 RDD family protein [Stagnihabitans tardus]
MNHAQQTLHVIPEARLFQGVAGRRLLAWVIDTVLIAVITTFLTVLTGFLALFFLGGLYVAVNFLYRWLGLARHSATLGMRMMGLTFIDRDTQAIDGGTAFLHTLFYTLSVAFVIPQVLSVLLIAFTRDHRSLSDIVLGTALVNREALGPTPIFR